MPTEPPARPQRRLHRAACIGAAIGLLPFIALLWDLGFDPLRRSTAAGTNANFFDLQARALFHGHLDVPPGSLGIEAFVVGGRHYLYFPPFPALLRMPLLLLTDRFDGRLTAPSMLLGALVLAFALVRLTALVRHEIRGTAPVGRFEAFGFAVIVASVLGGSTLVYVASEPWVYHEVYVWSAAWSVATLACLVALWHDTRGRVVALTIVCALATMLTRVPAGWALGFTLIATGICLLWRHRTAAAVDAVPMDPTDADVIPGSPNGLTQVTSAARAAGWWLVAGGVTTIVVGAGINWAKFRHPFLFPLADQVWSQLSAHRKVVLALNHGHLEGLRFLWTTLVAYFRPDGVRFVPYFPFVTLPAHPPTAVGDVVLDESFRTGSIPALMPLLFLLALWGLATVWTRGRAALRLPLLGALAATGAVMTFGYIAPRYTAEFVPVLAMGALVGFGDLACRIPHTSRRGRRVLLGAAAALAFYGLAANVAIGLVNARQAWRGEPLERLVSLRRAISGVTGNPLDGMVHEVDALPASAGADELFVVGDCDALYLATGERFNAWVPVQVREQSFHVTIGDDGLRPGSLRLVWFPGYTVHRLHLQVGLDGRVRIVLFGAPPVQSGDWFEVRPGDVIDVTVRGDTARNRYVATATSGALTSSVEAPMTEWDQQFNSVPIAETVTLGKSAAARSVGVTAEQTPGPVPALCDRLRD